MENIFKIINIIKIISCEMVGKIVEFVLVILVLYVIPVYLIQGKLIW